MTLKGKRTLINVILKIGRNYKKRKYLLSQSLAAINTQDVNGMQNVSFKNMCINKRLGSTFRYDNHL